MNAMTYCPIEYLFDDHPLGVSELKVSRACVTLTRLNSGNVSISIDFGGGCMELDFVVDQKNNLCINMEVEPDGRALLLDS